MRLTRIGFVFAFTWFCLFLLAGCGVKVDKSVNLHFDAASFPAGAQPYIAAPAVAGADVGAEAKAGDSDADSDAKGDATGQVAGRQHGLFNVIVVNTSGTQSEIDDALKLAAEASIAATGQGAAEVTDGGGATVNPSPPDTPTP